MLVDLECYDKDERKSGSDCEKCDPSMIATDFIMGAWEARRPVLAEGAKAIYYAIAFLLLCEEQK